MSKTDSSPLLIPLTKNNPGKQPINTLTWRHKKGVKKSAEARKVLKKPEPRVLQRIEREE